MTKLKFDEKKHEYSVNGKKLISVTTFVKSFFKPFDVKRIAKIVARSRRAKGEKNSKGKPITAWDIKREWKASATFGTRIHNEIETYIKEGVVASNIHERTQMAIDWLDLASYPLDKIQTELKIFDKEIGVAGTIDAVITDGNKVTLIDWKTNKAIRKTGSKWQNNIISKQLPDCNYTHYTLQLSLYAYLLERQGFEIDKLLLVHLKEYTTPYEVDYRKDIVEMMLNERRRSSNETNKKDNGTT